jgi:hypothetical protein
MKLLLTSLLLLFAFSSTGQQYEIEDIEMDAIRENGALTATEIQIINPTSLSRTIKCSLNKINWAEKKVTSKKAVEVHLTSDVAFFYVRLYDEKIYKLKPGMRYIVSITDNDKLILKILME